MPMPTIETNQNIDFVEIWLQAVLNYALQDEDVDKLLKTNKIRFLPQDQDLIERKEKVQILCFDVGKTKLVSQIKAILTSKYSQKLEYAQAKHIFEIVSFKNYKELASIFCKISKRKTLREMIATSASGEGEPIYSRGDLIGLLLEELYAVSKTEIPSESFTY